jgi:hypothetical protein
MKKFTTLALASALTVAMAVPAFAASTSASLWNKKDSFEDGTFTGGSAWAGAWMQVDLAEGEELASITLTVNTTDVVVAADEDGNQQEVLRYFYTQDDTEYHLFSDGTNTQYTVTYTADELAKLAEDGTIQVNNFEDGSVEGYGFSVQLGQSAGSVTLSYTLAGADDTTDTTDTTDNTGANDGDVAPVAYLAAVVALAGAAMVASKKVRA